MCVAVKAVVSDGVKPLWAVALSRAVGDICVNRAHEIWGCQAAASTVNFAHEVHSSLLRQGLKRRPAVDGAPLPGARRVILCVIFGAHSKVGVDPTREA